MKVTDGTRLELAMRRQRRDLLAAGYEKAAEPLWELDRGLFRTNERIVDVEIGADGKSLYVRTDKNRARAASAGASSFHPERPDKTASVAEPRQPAAGVTSTSAAGS